ncbi:alpha/beta fold hydrolase [Streptosporangium sp. G11]|uniref:alpha/beta fold hydrolase n=1 Tax=Streptosporangium sp. G11 TaxID=3436926 RepID=UPI003EBDACB3
MSPTIVLVHGAFAESASWNGVISRLREHDLTVIAAANPLRDLASDADALAGLVTGIHGPVILVGHSYGGQVISQIHDDKIKALVFVAAFAPETGESIGELSAKFPGSTLGETLCAFSMPDGSTDLYIVQNRYHGQFAADLPEPQALLDAVTQRPLNDRALNGKSAEPSWRTRPSWFIYPELDLNIPLETHRFMAARANATTTIEIPGASHALPVSQASAVADLILQAAKSLP